MDTVALTIPMVLAATAFVMSLMGIDLHRISLGALIIVLGLLVDDAMIAVEMMDRKLREGHDKLAAGTFAYTSTAFPMLTGTLITVAGFIPVGFAQSSAGEYVSSLFWVTGVALMISWFAAVYFTPWIGYRLLKVHNHRAGDRDVFDSRPYRAIRALVAWCVRRRWLVVVLTFVTVAIAVGVISAEVRAFAVAMRCLGSSLALPPRDRVERCKKCLYSARLQPDFASHVPHPSAFLTECNRLATVWNPH